jgi:hypothetical protein
MKLANPTLPGIRVHIFGLGYGRGQGWGRQTCRCPFDSRFGEGDILHNDRIHSRDSVIYSAQVCGHHSGDKTPQPIPVAKMDHVDTRHYQLVTHTRHRRYCFCAVRPTEGDVDDWYRLQVLGSYRARQRDSLLRSIFSAFRLLLGSLPSHSNLAASHEFKKKLFLSIALGFGVCAGIVAIYKCTTIPGVGDRTDFTFSTENLITWTRFALPLPPRPLLMD